MNLLIDTHALIWYLDGDNRLNQQKKDLIEDSSNKLYVSIASLWEISIKINIQKLEFYTKFDLIPANLQKFGIETLDIQFDDLKTYVNLPLHHKDPFDRILLVQAITNDLTILTEDQNFKLYQVNLA